MKRIFVLLILTSLLSACTKAISTTEMLSQIASLSSQSANPFQQDLPGDYFIVSGYCPPGTTGFEFRMNDLTMWSSIPTIAPTPDSSEGEYLVTPAPAYDLDCSDSQYSFFMFHSNMEHNFSLNNADIAEPYRIEIRSLPEIGLPSIEFNRPVPYTFHLRTLPYESTQFMESGRTLNFEVRLMDIYGKDTPPVVSDVVANLAAVNLTNSSSSAGSFYDSSCTSPISTLTFSATAGDRELEFCYKADSVTPEDQIQIEVGATGMVSKSYNLRVLGLESAKIQFFPFNGGLHLPPQVVKGVDYFLSFGLIPLFNYSTQDRYVDTFNGHFAVTSEADVMLKSETGDTSCRDFYDYGNLICSVSTLTTGKNIEIKVPLTSAESAVTITATSTPVTNCEAETVKCIINDPVAGTTPAISHYAPFSVSIPVVSGSASYEEPYFRHSHPAWQQDNTVEVNECREGFVGAGNSQGHLLPTPTASITMEISTVDSNVNFYASREDCVNNTTASTSLSISLSLHSLGAFFGYKVISIPTDNKVKFRVEEGLSTFEYDYYLSGTTGP